MEMFDDIQMQRIWDAMAAEGFNPDNWYVWESPVETVYIIHNVANTVSFAVTAEEGKPLYIAYDCWDGNLIRPTEADSFCEAVELSGIKKQEDSNEEN